jgi:Ca-activated chloride channel homolog
MELQNLHFADPNWLWGILLVPPALLAAFWHSRTRHSTLLVGNPRLVEMASSLISPQLIPWFFRFLILSLCFFAAARPQAGQKKIEEKNPVTDLFVTLDVSGSMITDDLKPSRIEAAKKILSEFLDEVQNVRVGLTIFARISFTQCPLTTDVAMVKKLLENVEPAPQSIKIDGTAIGDALVASLNRLQTGLGNNGQATTTSGSSALLSKLFKVNSSTDQEEAKPNSQAILLMTDGANNAGVVDPLTAARIVASKGIKIYAIGLGDMKRRIPAFYVGPGGRRIYALDQNGNLIYEDPLDMGLLNEIAKITGGKAYNASNNNTLKSVLDDIAKLEKRDVSVTTHWEYNELASYFLLAAFLLLVLDIGLETTVLRTLP